jgi:hypothetical protein
MIAAAAIEETTAATIVEAGGTIAVAAAVKAADPTAVQDKLDAAQTAMVARIAGIVLSVIIGLMQ